MTLASEHKKSKRYILSLLMTSWFCFWMVSNVCCNESSLSNNQQSAHATQTLPEVNADPTSDAAGPGGIDTTTSDTPNDTAFDTETNPATDTDSVPLFSDNYNACLEECTTWADDNICIEEKEICRADESCDAYATCIDTQCAQLEVGPLYSCKSDCRESTITSDQSLEYYGAIGRCVLSDFCRPLCAEIGGDSEHNCATCACYGNGSTEDENATDACFDWAGAAGPCIAQENACHTNDACTVLEECIDSIWALDGGNEIWDYYQGLCFEEAGPEIEALYWSYYQCIYCVACDVACAYDAESKNCIEYLTQ